MGKEMTPKQFFERLNQMKDGDAAYVVFTKEKGKIHVTEDIIDLEEEEGQSK